VTCCRSGNRQSQRNRQNLHNKHIVEMLQDRICVAKPQLFRIFSELDTARVGYVRCQASSVFVFGSVRIVVSLLPSTFLLDFAVTMGSRYGGSPGSAKFAVAVPFQVHSGCNTPTNRALLWFPGSVGTYCPFHWFQSRLIRPQRFRCWLQVPRDYGRRPALAGSRGVANLSEAAVCMWGSRASIQVV
jgi:hypothetical protein